MTLHKNWIWPRQCIVLNFGPNGLKFSEFYYFSITKILQKKFFTNNGNLFNTIAEFIALRDTKMSIFRYKQNSIPI